LLLGFAAVNTGNNLLYLMVSALLGFMAVSGLLGQQNLQRLEVKVLPAGDVYATHPSPVEIELVNNRRWLPAFLVMVKLGDDFTLFPLLAAGRRQRQTLSLVLPVRGYQPLPTIWVYSCFPINLFVRSRSLQQSQELLVFPCPQVAALPHAAGAGQYARRMELAQPGIDGELRSIDTYCDADPLKAIHWKLSARHDDYKVKRQNRLGAPSLLLDLADFNGSLEGRIGQCAYLVNELIHQQRAVGLRLDDQLYLPGHGRSHRLKLLTELALYGQH
jgi:uncharacterized protein (DUF58 family)